MWVQKCRLDFFGAHLISFPIKANPGLIPFLTIFPSPFFLCPSVFIKTPNFFSFSSIPLANLSARLEEADPNTGVVRALYEALTSGDAETVQRLLAPDLEWWFHGPPACQFLMRYLTGSSSSPEDTFTFIPQTIKSIGPIILAEGHDPVRSISWVHAWTVNDGVITQVREYFNTSLTVTRIGNSSKFPSTSASSSFHCLNSTLWESRVPDNSGKSMPGLVLAI